MEKREKLVKAIFTAYVLKHLPRAREEGAKKRSGKDRLPEECWRKVGYRDH